jgi:hypothetical protein
MMQRDTEGWQLKGIFALGMRRISKAKEIAGNHVGGGLSRYIGCDYD